MLKLNIQRILAGRAIERPFTYLVKQGFSKNFAFRLNAGKMRQVKLSDIEKLCVMFHCTPNELLEWIPAEKANTANHPLRDLIRINSNVDIRAVLNALPYDKLDEMAKLISEKAGKK
jgi:DNA-binding Xre family transcriptional regulator